jgi:cystathionine beta-lyase
MDFPMAPAITDRLQSIIDLGMAGYQKWGAGASPAGRVFVDRMASKYGWSIDVDRVHDLADVLQGVRLAIGMLTEPGDAIALHTPAYHPFLQSLADMDRRLVHASFDVDELRTVIASEKPAALLLCHPQNPTGHVFDRPQLEAIAEIVEEFNLIVISDEIHSDLVYAPQTHIPFASLSPAVESRTITVTSTSKAFNLASLRWAVMHVGIERFDTIVRSYPRHWFGSPNLFGVEAAVAAWTEGEEWLAAVMDVLDENRHRLAELVEAYLPGAKYQIPSATYLAWIDCSMLGDGNGPFELFQSRGVELSPGMQFGANGSGHVRLNFATSPAVVEQIVATMASS